VKVVEGKTYFASNGIKLFNCVRRRRVRKFLHTGRRRIATWTCNTRAHALAIANDHPNVDLAVLRLSVEKQKFNRRDKQKVGKRDEEAT
jgi:hypothetical protein